MSIWGSIKGTVGALFSSSRIVDTAVDGIRKMGGLDDMNGREIAAYILDYLKATKHQSVARRVLAFIIVLGFALFTGAWLIFKIWEKLFLFFGGDPKRAAHLTGLCDDLFQFCDQVLAGPYALVIGFYFAVNLADKFRG